VLLPALDQQVEERIIEVRSLTLPERGCQVEPRAMAAAEEVREVGRGEGKAVVEGAHVGREVGQRLGSRKGGVTP
jgi:hypothetical protein